MVSGHILDSFCEEDIDYILCIAVQGTSTAPKKTVRASEPSSLSAGGLDGLPREDISAKITPTLLKSLESPDWKVLLSIYLISFALYRLVFVVHFDA